MVKCRKTARKQSLKKKKAAKKRGDATRRCSEIVTGINNNPSGEIY